MTNKQVSRKIIYSFWLNNNYEIEEEYGKILEEYYFAESYSTNFNTESLEKICKSLECSIDELFVSDDPKMQYILTYASKLNASNNKNKSDTE